MGFIDYWKEAFHDPTAAAEAPATRAAKSVWGQRMPSDKIRTRLSDSICEISGNALPTLSNPTEPASSPNKSLAAPVAQTVAQTMPK